MSTPHATQERHPEPPTTRGPTDVRSNRQRHLADRWPEPVPRPLRHRHDLRPLVRPPMRPGVRSGVWSGLGERGSVAVELVLMAPVLMAMVLLVVAGGRFVDARGQVIDAAYAAARAASLAPSAGSAEQAGRQAAAASLAERGKACTSLQVTFPGTVFAPGGQVRAVVRCVADLSDVVGGGIPGTKSFSALAVVPIDQFRNLP